MYGDKDNIVKMSAYSAGSLSIANGGRSVLPKIFHELRSENRWKLGNPFISTWIVLYRNRFCLCSWQHVGFKAAPDSNDFFPPFHETHNWREFGEVWESVYVLNTCISEIQHKPGELGGGQHTGRELGSAPAVQWGLCFPSDSLQSILFLMNGFLSILYLASSLAYPCAQEASLQFGDALVSLYPPATYYPGSSSKLMLFLTSIV